MPDVKWTTEQENAIKIRNSKTLVAAGAGSGKTAVLVERIIRKVIEDGIDIDKMLIVTFTNAAASEMKERIRERLYTEASSNHALQKQILYLNRASIMTIDAFCKKAVKDYFYKLDIDPNFKIADTTELELMKLEAIDEVLEELYESQEEDIIDVLDAYSNNKSDDSLVNLILSIHRFIQSCPNPLEWLDEKCEMYHVDTDDFGNTVWGKYIIKYTRNVVAELLEELKNIRDDFENIDEAQNYLLTIQDDILALEALRKNNFSWDDYYQAFQHVEFSSLKRAPKLDEETREYVKSVREKMKSIIGQYLKEEVFISSSSEILQDLKNAYAHATGIKHIIHLFDARLHQKKEDKNVLDFSDIEHLCLKLFSENEDVLQDFKNKYEEILIDEYQDSNLIQESILNKISNGNVFMVGDVKQSIYKFRQAKPELFLEKYHTYPTWVDDGNMSTENKILLFKNFRSNENIIQQVNFIFQNIMFKDTGEIDYTEEEFLKYGATYYDYDGESAEIHIIESKNQQGKSEEADSSIFEDDIEEKAQLEARVVSKRIEELVGNFEVFDKNTKQKRKAKYSDIVILLRATKGYADTFAEELSKRNIPVYTDVKSGYFDNPEVQVVLSLLKIIDNPYQDIPLLSVLRSPIGNFDVNELTKIRMVDRKCSFFEAMMMAGGQGDEKVKDFLIRLSLWREKSRYLTIDELLSYLFDDTKYYYYVSLLPNGDRRQNNLKVLLKKATDYGKSSYKGLYNFLNFIDNVKLSSGDFTDAPSELSETDDVVRIMSIHKSKGLEFPIVILAGTARGFNKIDLQDRIVLNQEMGFGFDIVDTKKRLVYESVPKLALKLQNKKEMLAEEMRILYVAMTRAKEKLIITSLVQKMDKNMTNWSMPISKYAINNANNFADWICRVVLSTSNNWNVVTWNYEEAVQGRKKVTESDKNELMNVNQNHDRILEQSTFASENIDTDDNNTQKISNMDYDAFITHRFHYHYPYSLSTKIPAKLSVSELKRLNNLEDYSEIRKVKEIKKPSFLQEEPVKGAEYGTLLHSKMERLNFRSPNVEELLSDVKDSKVHKKLEKDIHTFLASSLYQKIICSGQVYRETPFNLSMSAKEVFPFSEDSADDEVMVQGIIDLYFETAEGLIVVDYKSDKNIDEEGLKARYAKQLAHYQRALEQITGKKVIEKYIYSFNLAKEILL